MPGRKFNTPTYRYGFNGKEKEDEIANTDGADLDFGARIYDARLGRWFRTDQLFYKYSGLSPYHFSYNSPISFVDSDGKDIFMYDKKGNLVSWVKIKNHTDIAFQMNNYEIPDNWEGPNVVNLDEQIEKLGAVNPFLANIGDLLPDAIGVGVAAKFDFPLVEVGYGAEAVYFLEGPNQFETHYYGSTSGEIGNRGLDASDEFLGGQLYFILGYNNTGKKDKLTKEFWAGTEESYSIAYPEIGGIGFEWSNDSDSPTLYPDFRITADGVTPNPNHVNQFEIIISPPLFTQAGGKSYSAGTVYNLEWLENIAKTPDKLVNEMLEIRRLTTEEHKQLKQNNLNRSGEGTVVKHACRFK
jgi:RHS repeat-associated protein